LPENDNDAWTQCQDFIKDLRNKESHKKSPSELLNERAQSFNFEFENLDEIEKLIKGNQAKINPQYYADEDPLTGFIMFVLRDALVYAGIIKGEGQSRHYSWLLHKQSALTA